MPKDIIAEVTTLKRKVEIIQKEVDMASGALKQLMQVLKNEFDCDTIEEGKVLLEQYKKEEVNARTSLEKELVKFQGNWTRELEE